MLLMASQVVDFEEVAFLNAVGVFRAMEKNFGIGLTKIIVWVRGDIILNKIYQR